MSQVTRLVAVHQDEWLEQFVYEIDMLLVADRLARAHGREWADWRLHNVGVEAVLVHARTLDAFLGGAPGAAVPVYAPFGAAADWVPGFTPQHFLTDTELLAISGTLGRFGSFSSAQSPWDHEKVVERARHACLALAERMPTADADAVVGACIGPA